MKKNIIGGIAVGMANIIPGVSGGTILVLLGLFNRLMKSVSNIVNFKIKFKDKMNDILFILEFLIGCAIGLIGFAKILEILFVKFEIQTLFLFFGLIICSFKIVKNKELGNEKINILFLTLGILLIALISFLAPGESTNIVTYEELIGKNINFIYLITLIIIGSIGGASMLFPGVSGSMVLLVLGWYHLFKGYVAHVTSFDIKILIPLIFIGIGVLLGIIVSAVITNYLLKNHKNKTMSFILGLILMSAITIIPTKGYTFFNSITSAITFLLGAGIVYYLSKIEKN